MFVHAIYDLACQAFIKAGLSELLGGIIVAAEDSIITVYVPTNDGMEAAGYTSSYIDYISGAHELETIMTSHIIRGSLTVDQLVCNEHITTILEGAASSVKIGCPYDGSISSKTISGFYNDGSDTPTILAPFDIALCNGLVQPLSHVILVTEPH